MAKAKKAAKKQSKAAKDKALADGAAEIKNAQTEAASPEPLEIPELSRDIKAILEDRVSIAPGHIGLTMADDTPIEEHLAVLDYATSLSDHVGFMIGDVLNNGAIRWGDKYKVALDQTGRALSTLKGYSEAARKIPVEKRVASLTFSHHRELIRLPVTKMEKLLEDLEKESEKKDGHIPQVRELRVTVQKQLPRKRPKRVTSGKHGKGGKKTVELPPYEPTDAEKELFEEGELAVEETAKLLKPDGKLFKALVQMDNKTKQRWLSKLDNIVLFFKALEIKTGTY